MILPISYRESSLPLATLWRPEGCDRLNCPLYHGSDSVPQERPSTLHFQGLEPHFGDVLVHDDFNSRDRDADTMQTVQFGCLHLGKLCLRLFHSLLFRFYFDIAIFIVRFGGLDRQLRACDGANLAKLCFENQAQARKALFWCEVRMRVSSGGRLVVDVGA